MHLWDGEGNIYEVVDAREQLFTKIQILFLPKSLPDRIAVFVYQKLSNGIGKRPNLEYSTTHYMKFIIFSYFFQIHKMVELHT